MHVVIFEGNRWPSFAPLSLSRPVFMLRCGLSTLLEQQIRRLRPTRLTLWVRPKLADYCLRHVVPNLSVPTRVNEPLDDEPALLSSGRGVHLHPYDKSKEQCVVLDEAGRVRMAYAHAPGLTPADGLLRTPSWTRLLELPRVQAEIRLPHYVWDLIEWNGDAITADAAELGDDDDEYPAGAYHMVAKENIHLASSVILEPGVVLDASKGPIVIDAGAKIGANCVIQGPCHIGMHTILVPLTLIRPGTSIGPGCKIGGEVSASIIVGDTNKSHYGYLGNSYVGQWVNLGAGTSTSNLKNTYGKITMRIGPHEIPTDRQFLGSIIGDHAKTAIGTRLMTGSYVGYCANLAGSNLPPKYIPSLTFWTDKGSEPYRLDKAKEMISRVLERRGKSWSEEDQTMLDYASATAAEVENV